MIDNENENEVEVEDEVEVEVEVEDEVEVHLISEENSSQTECGEEIVGGMRTTDGLENSEGDVTCVGCFK